MASRVASTDPSSPADLQLLDGGMVTAICSAMRIALALTLLTACAAEEPTGPDLPQPIDVVWGNSIHAGDMFVLVPGTDSYDYYAAVIDPMTAEVPEISPRTNTRIADDAIVLEQAIAAAHRANIPNSQLEDGTIQFGMWGVGFLGTHTSFTYVSYEGIRIPVDIIGGTSKCSMGSVAANLLNYSGDNANADATDLYIKTQSWLTMHPATNVIVASHSWGGAVAEYLAQELPTISSANGPLGANMPFTIAMGVPGFVLGYTFNGPGLRNTPQGLEYEVDRPDDPVHVLHAGEPGGGHQYDIMYGDAFQGSYGITTNEMSCETVPGPCAQD
jgi:hypothetical protein